jgi:hypothetical protein
VRKYRISAKQAAPHVSVFVSHSRPSFGHSRSIYCHLKRSLVHLALTRDDMVIMGADLHRAATAFAATE